MTILSLQSFSCFPCSILFCISLCFPSLKKTGQLIQLQYYSNKIQTVQKCRAVRGIQNVGGHKGGSWGPPPNKVLWIRCNFLQTVYPLQPDGIQTTVGRYSKYSRTVYTVQSDGIHSTVRHYSSYTQILYSLHSDGIFTSARQYTH